MNERSRAMSQGIQTFAAAGQARAQVEVAKTFFEITTLAVARSQLTAQSGIQSCGVIVHALHAAEAKPPVQDGSWRDPAAYSSRPAPERMAKR